ncbi:helix-turn-helix transcriptional regulator [Fictibacillus sp. WQ 8-8]|uniref:helix-turn-helix domain-containing protein n=1 Tax=Fictibacillus sp. WQ 8-8 TaxID=2938788 RepID=UPI00210D13A2|nr:helix-turn-helix transcriptional regulator [Fictibacillus sp. WQ 8-8]MCQ6268873.1 helix-turn-helix transcriptional regulator [Fictibacillus sp. WQ 8-8]
MLQDLGQKIRLIRTKKGISLNTFAEQIGVSSGYLSNLETGKTNNIDLPVLDTIQKKLFIIPMVPPDQEEDEISYRFQRVITQFRELANSDAKAAEYLLSSFENGLDHFLK